MKLLVVITALLLPLLCQASSIRGRSPKAYYPIPSSPLTHYQYYYPYYHHVHHQIHPHYYQLQTQNSGEEVNLQRGPVVSGTFSRSSVESNPIDEGLEVVPYVPLRDAIEAYPDNSLKFYMSVNGIVEDVSVVDDKSWKEVAEDASVLEIEARGKSRPNILSFEDDVTKVAGKFSRAAVEAKPTYSFSRRASFTPEDEDLTPAVNFRSSVAGSDEKNYARFRIKG